MNVITVLIDSLNRHMIGPYGGEVPTPNMDRLAARGVVFDNHFIGSAPCMPARRELMTGRKEFLWRGWGPLEPFDDPIAVRARQAGAVTAIVTDHYHYWEYPAHGYLEHFDAVRMIRGHELDMYNTDTLASVPRWAQNIDQWRPGWGTRYYNNVKDYREEKDFFAPRTMAEACDWLDGNHAHDPFMLWVECFDVHEPFHVPEPYRSMFTGEELDDHNCWPPYQTGYHGHEEKWWETASEQEVAYVRAQYKGKIAMVDAHLGKLLERMDRYNLWDNTMIVLTTDHGHELGEKERFGKQPPHYDLHANIPLILCMPGLKPGRREALTTAVDIYPTILEALGADASAPHGRSLLPLARGETDRHREAVVYGTFACGATITDGRYTYHTGWDAQAPVYEYCATMLYPEPEARAGKYLPGVDCPVWRMPRQSLPEVEELLFDRIADPGQERNILAERPDVRRQMRELLCREMAAEAVPPEQYRRLRLDEAE